MGRCNVAVFIAIVLVAGVAASAARICSRTDDRNAPEYFLLAVCHRSTLRIISQSNCASLERCKQFALQKRGMAFNFKPPERRLKKKLNINDSKNCMILSCPEIENSTSLKLDSNYDYYSMFADPVPPINSSCIPGVGMFVFHLTGVNYTIAKESCQEFGATIADVATESRTNALSYLVMTYLTRDQPKQVFIGLEDINIEGQYRRSTGDLLKCTTFRAWAPGHPKNYNSHHDCGILKADKSWQIVDCRRKLPFVCEIYPGGSHEYYDYFDRPNCFDSGQF